MLPFGIDYENENEARCIYETLIESLKNKNRFFIDEWSLDALRHLFNERESFIQKDSILYRAREYDSREVKNKKDKNYEGYDAEGSFVNFHTKWPTEGRMNPQGIYTLYCASDIETCIAELKPHSGGEYSVATIVPKQQLKIADLSIRVELKDEKDVFFSTLCKYIVNGLSKGSGGEDYIFPQFIAAFCKHCGYDGIAYRSKYASFADTELCKGINYSIFSYDKCEPKDSKIYDVEEVKIKITRSPFRDE